MSVGRQVWAEGAGILAVLAGAAGVWWCGADLPAAAQVLLYGLLLVPLAVILRRFWQWLLGPLLGGVDPQLVLAGFVVVLMNSFTLANQSIVLSTISEKSFEAYWVSYLLAAPCSVYFSMPILGISLPPFGQVDITVFLVW